MPTAEQMRHDIEEMHRVALERGGPPIANVSAPGPLSQAQRSLLEFDRPAHARWLRTLASDMLQLADWIDPPGADG